MRRWIEAYRAWRYRRWLRSPEGQRFMTLMAWLVEHQSYEQLHMLSADVYAKWNDPHASGDTL